MNRSQKGGLLGGWLGIVGSVLGCTAWILVNSYLLKDWSLFIQLAAFDLIVISASLLLLLKYPTRSFSIFSLALFSLLLVVAAKTSILLAEVPIGELPYPADVKSVAQIQNTILWLLPLPTVCLLADILGFGTRIFRR